MGGRLGAALPAQASRGDAHGGPCLVDQQLHSGKRRDSGPKES